MFYILEQVIPVVMRLDSQLGREISPTLPGCVTLAKYSFSLRG